MATEYHLEIQFRSSKYRPMIHLDKLEDAKEMKRKIIAHGFEEDADADGPIIERTWSPSEIVCITISKHEHTE